MNETNSKLSSGVPMTNSVASSNPSPQTQSAPSVPAVPSVPVTPAVENQAGVVTPPVTAKKLNLPKLDPKEMLEKIKGMQTKYKIMAGFVLLLIFLLIVVGLTKPGRRVVGLILPSATPIPTVTPIGEVFVPSPYATDPEVIEIEKKLSDLDTKLKGTNLNEDTLRIPNLDWDITFKEK